MVKMLLWVFLTALATTSLTSVVAAGVVVPGTGDSQALLRQLAAEFQANTGIEVEIPDSIGSFGGIRKVAEGEARLGRVARPIRADEEQFKLNYRIFAYSPVVLVTNQPDHCIANLTSQQLVGIYRGELVNWMKFQGCSAAKIFVAGREPGDSSRTVLEKYLPSLKEDTDFAGKMVYTTPELIDSLNNFPYSIGYAPLAMVDQRKLRVLSLNGVAPTAENVRNGSYPLVIPFGIIWKGELSGDEKRFVDFLFNSETQQRISELGLNPVR
jgi:phosphate transport system substrate-binding protein